MRGLPVRIGMDSVKTQKIANVRACGNACGFPDIFALRTFDAEQP